MYAHVSAEALRAERWQGALELLDSLELICGGVLTDDAWDTLLAEVVDIDPQTATLRDPDAIREVARAAIRAAEITSAAAPAAEPEPVVETTPEPEPVVETTPEPEPVVETTPEPETVAETTPEPETVAETTPEPETVAETTPEPAASAATLTWVDVAVAVLRATGKEMNARAIYDHSVEHGPHRPTAGATPWQTIARDLRNAVAKGDKRLIKGSARGTFRSV